MRRPPRGQSGTIWTGLGLAVVQEATFSNPEADGEGDEYLTATQEAMVRIAILFGLSVLVKFLKLMNLNKQLNLLKKNLKVSYQRFYTVDL